jgi:hypothetical protein
MRTEKGNTTINNEKGVTLMHIILGLIGGAIIGAVTLLLGL